MDNRKDILCRIEEIRSNNLLEVFVANLTAKLIHIPGVNIIGRVKNLESAIKKMDTKGYADSELLTDLVGVMIVTKTIEDVYEVVDIIKSSIHLMGERDYIAFPKNGYASYHVDVEENDIKIEIQIKTYEMKRAQDLIHKNIYKNPNISENIKPVIMKPLFSLLMNIPEDILEKNAETIHELIGEFDNVSNDIKDIQSILDRVFKTIGIDVVWDGLNIVYSKNRTLRQDR